GDRQRALARLRDISEPDAGKSGGPGVGTLALFALPRVGGILLPGAEGPRARLEARLMRAGYYGPQAMRMFLGAKLLLVMAFPVLFALIPFVAGLLAGQRLLIAATVGCGAGMLLPDFWLESRRKARQSNLRRALPDFLDMTVLCVEGGVSLAAALQRVTD